MNHTSALVAAAIATAVLAAVHAAVPAIRRRIDGRHQVVLSSLGGGVAVAYVFAHLLPEVARGNEEVGEVLQDVVQVTAFNELVLFLVAMGGFLMLYGFDHLARHGQGDDGGRVYAVHLGAYAVYNAVITYTLIVRFEAGAVFAGFFVVAMALHFFLSDRNLARHHGRRFARSGRVVLVGALVFGYFAGWAMAPTSTLIVNVLVAALGGFVLYNVFSEELPDENRSRFPVFAASAILYAGLLLVVTMLEG